MKTMYIGAASLMALGMAACGERTEYAEEEETTETAAYEDETADEQTGAAGEPYDTARADDPAGTTTSGDPAAGDDALDPYGETDTAADTPIGQEPTGTAASVQPVSMTIAEVETEDDLSQLLDDAFRRADADQNNQLSREEFQILTATLAPADMAQPLGAPMTQDETAMEGEGDIGGTQTTDVAAEERIFAEAAGTGDAVEKESLREAFLARFKTADQDGDDRLNPEERDEFVRIALGGDAQSQTQTPEQNQ